MSDLIKRKDGSYSRRGLWDNIRANKGSGKKPTKEMLAQERKIKNLQTGGGILDYIKKGISSAIDYINPFESEDEKQPVKTSSKEKPVPSTKVPYKILESQGYKESTYNPNAFNKDSKAAGWAQIKDIARRDYNQRYHTKYSQKDLFNPEIAIRMQTNIMNSLYNRPWINVENQPENVRLAKTLIAYNQGATATLRKLNELKSKGIDIYKNTDWIKHFSTEPRQYVEKILLRKDPKFNREYDSASKVNPHVKFYREQKNKFGRGGMLWFNQKGGSIVDPRGQWAHPGKVTTIPGNDITMKGVPYPVFAETDKKQQVIMQPEQEYHFPGAKSVTEYPMPTTHAYKISKYLLPQHKEGGTMEKFGNVPYDAADAHKKPLSNGLWALPFKNGGQLYGKSGIHIKPENRGKFTASANRAGMGVQAFASKVLANKEKYSPTLVKRANFARNAAKWKHQFGGSIDTLKMALGGQMGSPKARISTPLRTDRSSAAGMMNFTEDSSPKARMFEGGDFPNSTFGDKTIPAKSYKMGGHMLSRPDHWVQAGDAVQDLNKNPQQSWYGESNRAKATAPVFQGGVKKPLLGQSGIKFLGEDRNLIASRGTGYSFPPAELTQINANYGKEPVESTSSSPSNFFVNYESSDPRFTNKSDYDNFMFSKAKNKFTPNDLSTVKGIYESNPQIGDMTNAMKAYIVSKGGIPQFVGKQKTSKDVIPFGAVGNFQELPKVPSGQVGLKMPMSKKLIPIIPPKLSEEQKRAKAEKFAEKSLNWNRTERRKNFGDSRLENMAEAGLKWFGGWKGLPLNLALKGNDINYNVNNSKGNAGFEFASQLVNALPNFPGNSKSVGERMSTAFGLLGPIALGGDAIQDNWIDNGTDNPILPFAPDRRHPSAMGVPMRYVRQARKRLKEERENKSTSAPEYRMGGKTKFSKMC